MWIADSEIMNDGHFDDNTGPQPMRGKAPLLLMTAASVLIHALVLGLLFTTLVNPFAWEADRQDSSVIQVTLSSLVANSVSRPVPIPCRHQAGKILIGTIARTLTMSLARNSRPADLNLDNTNRNPCPRRK